MGYKNRYFDLCFFHKRSLWQVSDEDRWTVDFHDIFRLNVLNIIEAVNQTVGIFIAVSVRELKHVETFEERTFANTFETLLYPDLLKMR